MTAPQIIVEILGITVNVSPQPRLAGSDVYVCGAKLVEETGPSKFAVVRKLLHIVMGISSLQPCEQEVVIGVMWRIQKPKSLF